MIYFFSSWWRADFWYSCWCWHQSILTEVIATASGVHSFLPAAFVHRHLKSLLGRVCCWIWAEVTDLQLGKVLGKVLKRHPTTGGIMICHIVIYQQTQWRGIVRRKYTWKLFDGAYRNQSDYIMVQECQLTVPTRILTVWWWCWG